MAKPDFGGMRSRTPVASAVLMALSGQAAIAQVAPRGPAVRNLLRAQAIGRVTAIFSDIAAATAEQSSNVAQVGEAVAQMDQVTQQNSALVEETKDEQATGEGGAEAAVQWRVAGGLAQAVEEFAGQLLLARRPFASGIVRSGAGARG